LQVIPQAPVAAQPCAGGGIRQIGALAGGITAQKIIGTAIDGAAKCDQLIECSPVGWVIGAANRPDADARFAEQVQIGRPAAGGEEKFGVLQSGII